MKLLNINVMEKFFLEFRVLIYSFEANRYFLRQTTGSSRKWVNEFYSLVITISKEKEVLEVFLEFC